MFGYPTNDHYYHDASPVHRLKSVQVPMLCLNAADDVFSPSHGEPFTPLHLKIIIGWMHEVWRMTLSVVGLLALLIKEHRKKIPCFLCSHSSWGSKAESQPGPAHHLSRRPYWFPGGSVASTEHLHGPSLQAVCKGGHWTRQPAQRNLQIREPNKRFS